ncbi:hypothetical protein [Streptomyces cupreus]|uniref:Uncharacterized protein n=1 Tax=Streptomyces cupreus TaxID=2759956 RepID=A0A7X1J4P6_9ACTN|nr:hypothetical protein [Streptomyces cupreus]MBC2903137.1 hypothetical protein [Streptomyces cupreus]
MGFREPSTIVLTFEPGDEYHGLEVRMRGMSIADWLQAAGLDGGDGDDTAATMKRFYDALIAWNLEDEHDQPVPVTDAPNRDSRMIRRLNNAWIQHLQGVRKNDPLPDNSPSGETSPAPPIPMTPVNGSENPAS